MALRPLNIALEGFVPGADPIVIAVRGLIGEEDDAPVTIPKYIRADLAGTSTFTGHVRAVWIPKMNYSIAFSSHFTGVQGTIAAGDVICRSTSNTYAIADSANLTAGGVATAIAITAGSSGIPVMLQYTGEIDASISGLGSGTEALAIVTSAGRIARLVTATPTDVVIGRVDAVGNVALSFAVPRVPRYGSAAPSTGAWLVGDIVYNTAPTAGGFLGWVCVTAGSPGTWKTFGAITS